MSDARNTAIRAARGTYLAYLDSDDTWRPEHLGLHVGFLSGSRERASHSDMALHAPGRRVTYRAYEGGHEELAHGNYIGLPSLVHERSLLDEVGLFNRDLRRCVDYDLILRIADVTDIHHIRACTCDVNNDPSARRISTSVASGDCHRLRAEATRRWLEPLRPTREHAEIGTVIIIDHVRPDRTARLLGQARAFGSALCVVNHGFLAISSSLGLDCLAMLAGAEVVHLAHADFYGLAVQLGADSFESDVVVVAPSTVEDLDPFLTRLPEAFHATDVAMVQPVVLRSDGVIASAGRLAPPSPALGVPHLAGQPADDAPDEDLPLAAVTTHCWAFRRAERNGVLGADPGFRTGLVSVAMSYQRRCSGEKVLLLSDATVRLLAAPAQEQLEGAHLPADLAELAQIPTPTADIGLSADNAWARIGIDVVGWRDALPSSRPSAGWLPLMEPVLGRRRDASDPLRWAIKSAAPPGQRGLSWGDWHFAHGLAAALRRLGQHVVVDCGPSSGRQSAYLDDVVVVLRGLQPQRLSPLQLNVLWVISHPDDISDDEMRDYDAVFAASHKFAREAQVRGIAVTPLLQCTDPSRFSPDVPRVDADHELLFVGNSRHTLRPMVRWALEAGRRPDIYGRDWDGLLDAALVKGEYVPNEVLASYYRHAQIVLNDHWPDMARDGFLSNRLFDLAASAATIITDPVDGLVDVFGTTPRVVDGASELAALLDQPQSGAFPDLAERLALAERVRVEHSFDARARTLLSTARGIWTARVRSPEGVAAGVGSGGSSVPGGGQP